MQNLYGNPMGKTKQVCPPSPDDDDDDDYENANPSDLAPVVPSRKTRRMDDLALKCMDKPAKQPPSVWTTSQIGIIPKETPTFQPPPIGLHFSSGAVNTAFADVEALAHKFPTLEVMSNRNQQRSGRSCWRVLAGFMVVIFIALVVFTGITFTSYTNVSGKVVDLEKTVKLQEILMAEIKQINKTLERICALCPVGWNIIDSSCYFVSGEETTWDLARDECYKMNSVLVMVKDKTESDSLKKLFSAGRRYWIGLRRDPEELHIWRWLDGTQITFINWGVNEPNYYSSREHCGETMSGPWNDRRCSDNLFYICKKIRMC